MRNRWILFIIVGLLIIGPSAKITPSVSLAQGQAENDAPYIYYFSDDLNAWVIERADGTDKRLLGQGLVKPSPYEVGKTPSYGGPGWSPSGDWFAFTVGFYSPYGSPVRGAQSIILSSDGTEQFHWLDHLQDIRMAWSPVEDLLLVASRYHDDTATSPEPETEIVQASFMLIDVPKNQILYQKETRTPVNDDFINGLSSSPRVKWLRDGDFGLVEYENAVYPEPEAYFQIYDTTSLIIERQYPLWRSRLSEVSADGNIVYFEDDWLIVDNLIDGTSQRLPFQKDAQTQWDIKWSPDGRQAIIDAAGLWLLTIEPELALTTLQAATRVEWSPDGRWVALQDEAQNLYLFEPATQKFTHLRDAYSEGYIDWRWMDDGRLINLASPQDEVAREVAIYDFSVQMNPIQTFHMEGCYWFVQVTLNGHYAACIMDGPLILEVETAKMLRLRPSANSYDSDLGGEVKWDSDGEWVLTFDTSNWGGFQEGIVRFDGTGQRDLGYSVYNLNWLPPQVDPTELPPPVPNAMPQPVQILKGETWSFYLAWSPDSQQIASGTYWRAEGFGDIGIWDVEAGRWALTFPEVRSQQVTWEEGVNGHYLPVLSPAPPQLQIQGASVGYPLDDEGRLAIAFFDMRPTVVDATTGEILQEIEYGYYQSEELSPNGRWLAIAYRDRPAIIYDTQTWEIVGQLPYAGTAVAFSPDSQYLAVGVSWDVEIWRVSDLIGQAAE